MWNRNSVVSMATRLRAGRLRSRGSIYNRREQSVLQNFQSGSGAHPAKNQGVSGTFTGNRALGDEADHSSHRVSQTEMSGAAPPLPSVPKGLLQEIYYLTDFCENQIVISMKTA